MSKWGHSKLALRVDPEAGTLQYGDEQVLKASITSNKLDIKYESGWKEYLEPDAEWKEHIAVQSNKLTRAAGAKGDSKGKGKTRTQAKDGERPPNRK